MSKRNRRRRAMITWRHRQLRCLACLRPVNSASDPSGQAEPPSTGDLSICLRCGHIAAFAVGEGEVMELRELGPGELAEALINPDVQRMLAARATMARAIEGELAARGVKARVIEGE